MLRLKFAQKIKEFVGFPNENLKEHNFTTPRIFLSQIWDVGRDVPLIADAHSNWIKT